MSDPQTPPEATSHIPRARITIFYAAIVLITIFAFLAIRSLGRDHPAATLPSVPSPEAPARMEVLPRVLLALATVIVVSRILGFLFRKLNQPRVIGEVLAGILLGPSLLGRVAPDVANYLLPSQVAPFLNILAQVGVVLFMFLVGLELDSALLRTRTHAALAISHASIVAPFLLGCASALLFYPRLAGPAATFDTFSLFLGVSMAVTAFPVLARILTERGLASTRLGSIAISCAAIDDVTAWCLLAYLVASAQAGSGNVILTIALTGVYVIFMLFVVRKIVKRFACFQGDRELRQGMFAIALVAVLASALTTEMIGIHALFGAFLLGAIVPHDSNLARQIRSKTEDLVLVLLLPAFFAFTGMRTQIGLVDGIENWLACGFIILIATAGKFGGSFVAGKISGLTTRDAAAIGILMNTRGLMELIVLNVGLDLRIISPTLFAILVIMAVVTTFATTPLLTLLERGAPGTLGGTPAVRPPDA